jgi:DNA polymerase-1
VTAHGGVENLLADPAAITNPKLREKIVAAADLIRANREMVRLDDDLPLPALWTTFGIRPNYPELIRVLRDCEFRGLLKEVEAEAARSGNAGGPGQQELF